MNELILIRGIPGSGKSTLAKTMNAEHYEADMWFAVRGCFDPTKIKVAHAWCLAKAVASMAEGKTVVVSNTFIRRWELQPYIDAAKLMGIRVREIVCNGRWANRHGVPEQKVAEMAARFEP